MKKIRYIQMILIIAAIGVLSSSCKKNNTPTPDSNSNNQPDTTGTLKDAATAAGIHFGMAVGYDYFTTDPNYASIVRSNCDEVTFENEMKGERLMQDDGSVDFTKADALLDAVTNAGLKVYGHTLVWYQQQNGNYLNSSIVGEGPNLLTNGDFESWNGTTPTGWSYYNQINGNFSQATGTENVHGGTYSLAANVTGGASDSWKLQVASPNFPVIEGHEYVISFWIFSPISGSVYQVEGRSPDQSVAYSGNKPTPTKWALRTFSFIAATSGQAFITFDMGGSINGTTYIDDVYIYDRTAAQQNTTPAEVAHRLDSIMHNYITNVVGHYAGKVRGWDVVNELFTNDGHLRNNANTPNSEGNPHIFVWSNYLGDSLAIKAFKYAHEADPSALLFINDYGLETNIVKLDSLIAYVQKLRALGVPIDGIGTQMHIAWNTPKDGIDNMFQKLASTGLKIRISELDVRVNPNDDPNFPQGSLDDYFAKQAEEYKNVVESYFKYVPKDQRYGITVWGVDDGHSWLYNNGKELPLLFDKNYKKKQAFYAVLKSLLENKP